MQGQIIKALAGFYYVESDGQVYQTRARGNFRKKGHTLYIIEPSQGFNDLSLHFKVLVL